MARWIVVGGGAAGVVVAAGLSADESAEVVLLEAGADHGAGAVAGDRGPFFGDPDRVVTYPVRRQPDRTAEPYALGTGLGGSSLINGSIVVPGGPGGDGRHAIPLESPERIGPLGAALLAADARAERLLLTTGGGRRVTAADAYLRPVSDRPNLDVVTGASVHRVILDGRRAVGVATTDGRTFGGDRIVLTAGALGTPVLLLRSGVDAPGIGHHLQDHPAVAIVLALTQHEPGADDERFHDITVATTTASHQIIALERTDPVGAYGALIVGLTQTTSRGTVSIDDDGEAVVSLDQLATADDRSRMVAAALDAIDLAERAAFDRVAIARLADDRGTPLGSLDRGPDAIGGWVRDRLTGFHHVAGTCRRGEVTDDDGWVRGHDHLAVADASLFVDLPSTNPYLATVLQADELVRRWQSDGR